VLANINTVEHLHKPVLIYNVSYDGMYLVTSTQLAVGTSLSIHISWPHSDTHLEIPAIVMYSSGNGAGVLIWRRTKEIEAFISQLCEENDNRFVGETGENESESGEIYRPIFRSL
jgi:hypothetical protein